jgi:hypothetical protein
MKRLIDMNLSPLWVEYLGPKSAERQPRTATSWSMPRRTAWRFLLTNLDFGALLAFRNARPV